MVLRIILTATLECSNHWDQNLCCVCELWDEVKKIKSQKQSHGEEYYLKKFERLLCDGKIFSRPVQPSSNENWGSRADQGANNSSALIVSKLRWMFFSNLSVLKPFDDKAVASLKFKLNGWGSLLKNSLNKLR